MFSCIKYNKKYKEALSCTFHPRESLLHFVPKNFSLDCIFPTQKDFLPDPQLWKVRVFPELQIIRSYHWHEIFFRPIVFSMDGDSTYEADFVLATLIDHQSSTQSSQASVTAAPTTSAKKVPKDRNVKWLES